MLLIQTVNQMNSTRTRSRQALLQSGLTSAGIAARKATCSQPPCPQAPYSQSRNETGDASQGSLLAHSIQNVSLQTMQSTSLIFSSITLTPRTISNLIRGHMSRMSKTSREMAEGCPNR